MKPSGKLCGHSVLESPIVLRRGNGPCVQDSDRTEGFELGEVEEGGDLQETLHGVRCSLHRENAAKSRGEIEGTPAACREERSEGFCDCRACDEDRSHNRLGRSASGDYEQRWGARKIKESLHIKRERANPQLLNRDGGLTISRVWQLVIRLTSV